jgi:thiamine-monophosphate kinase
MARLTERQLVARFRERFRSGSGAVRVGIGDDAAVLATGAGVWVCSVDACVEGVHFDLDFLTLEDTGYRAFQAAASDLAAMGATPVAALSALILPRGLSSAAIDELTRGQALASAECKCPIVGGNVSRGHELSLTTTVMGECERPLCRDGARPGDELWVVGPLGLSAAGLSCLRLGPAERSRLARAKRASSWVSVARCIQAWRRPQALLLRGRELGSVASAGIDVSDGLASDAWQLARASRVKIVVDQERLRAALDNCLLETSRVLRRSALQFALYGGEDYALLATGPSSRRPPWANAIGYVVRGMGAFLHARGQLRPLRRGYDHLGRA